jgi:hypothetical protein
VTPAGQPGDSARRGFCQTPANPSELRNSWRAFDMHPRPGMLCGIISVAGDRRGQLTPCTGGQQWRRKRWRSNAFRLETPAALRRKVSALCTTHRLPAEMIPALPTFRGLPWHSLALPAKNGRTNLRQRIVWPKPGQEPRRGVGDRLMARQGAVPFVDAKAIAVGCYVKRYRIHAGAG